MPDDLYWYQGSSGDFSFTLTQKCRSWIISMSFHHFNNSREPDRRELVSKKLQSTNSVNGPSSELWRKFNGQLDQLWVPFLKYSWCYRNSNISKCRILETSFLIDSALHFFHTLDVNTKAHLESTIAAFKNRFWNPILREIHHINSKNKKFNHKTECSEDF